MIFLSLFASFAGFRAAPGQNAVRVFPPAYYLKITCPQCAMYSFERFSVGADDSGEHLMTPRNPEDIKRLAEMCDKALELYAQKADGLETAISEYNALLKTILEPEQLAVLDKYAN